jgi:tetratricopeptide (TPR) repeat protein
MRRAAEDAIPYLERNPRLASLFGFADADRSNLARKSDRFEEALGLANRALATGDHVSFHHERAHSLFRLGRLKEAMAAIDRALELSPGSPEFLVDRAWYWLRQTDDEAARANYELAREIDPSFDQLKELNDVLAERAARPSATIQADALVARARRAWDRHDFDSASIDLREAVRIDPAHVSACRHLHRLLGWRRQWGEVIETWDAYLAARPDDREALLERADALQQAGRRHEAVVDLERACELGEKRACEKLGKHSPNAAG